MNYKFEVWIGFEVWIWSMNLKYEFEVWMWSMNMKYEFEVWIWRRNLKLKKCRVEKIGSCKNLNLKKFEFDLKYEFKVEFEVWF